MRYLEYLKIYRNFDEYLLFLDELGFSSTEISTMTGSSIQSIYNAKDRQKWLISALKDVKSENKQYGDPGVTLIINTFKDSYQTTRSTKYDRWAAKRLADKHGADKIVMLIKILSQSTDQYRPVINSVNQLEEKWPSIANFFKNKSSNQSINTEE